MKAKTYFHALGQQSRSKGMLLSNAVSLHCIHLLPFKLQKHFCKGFNPQGVLNSPLPNKGATA
jgi:hypothetical protein